MTAMCHGIAVTRTEDKMPENSESFSNPLAPSNFRHGQSGGQGSVAALTNADFRKLLMTPRVDAPSVAPPSANKEKVASSSHSKSQHTSSRTHEYNEDDDPEARRRKKKRYYAKLKKMEEEREKDLASRYRDRARERRDGVNPDYQGTDTLSTTANYRAVGPTAEASNTAAERRRMVIQESKFLGGDMEHTHLVKGLDYALLQKVRSEIDIDNDEDLDAVKKTKSKQKGEASDEEAEDMEFKTRIGHRVYKALFRSKPAEKNELFQPGRMAFVFELEDEYAESDIPTTLIRSKADCPGIETQATLTTNDIVINKLTQILLYLRQGMRGKKMKKKDKGKDRDKSEKESHKIQPPGANISIYGDIGDYDPAETTRGRSKGKDKAKEKERRKSKSSGYYFEKPEADEKEEKTFNKKDVSATEFAKAVTQKFKKVEDEHQAAWDSKRTSHSKGKKKSDKPADYVADSYTECYPGGMEVAYDSDDEADYTKMDMGNKKGPIKRWDFENEEDYEAYMERREALPKAAFQFGIKMAEGRKTRRAGPKDEKAKLDRDWQRISQMLHKRKGDERGDGGSESKKSRH